MLTLDSQLVIPAHVTSTLVDEDTVLLNTRTNQYFALQEVSSRLWTLLKEGQGLRQACHTLQEEYTVEPAELERDVLEIIGQLMENGLVEFVEG